MIWPGELTREIVEEHRHWLLRNASDANEVNACRQYFDQRLSARRRVEANESICASINRRRDAEAAKREAAQIEAAATGKSIDPALVAAAHRRRPGLQDSHDELASTLTEIVGQLCRDAPDLTAELLRRAAAALSDAAPLMREFDPGKRVHEMPAVIEHGMAGRVNSADGQPSHKRQRR